LRRFDSPLWFTPNSNGPKRGALSTVRGRRYPFRRAGRSARPQSTSEKLAARRRRQALAPFVVDRATTAPLRSRWRQSGGGKTEIRQSLPEPHCSRASKGAPRSGDALTFARPRDPVLRARLAETTEFVLASKLLGQAQLSLAGQPFGLDVATPLRALRGYWRIATEIYVFSRNYAANFLIRIASFLR
jgi:hypothetical protein